MKIAASVIGVGIIAAALTGCAVQAAPQHVTHTPVAQLPAITEAPPLPTVTPPFDYNDAAPTIDLKIMSKQCFGSAGCNVTVKPVLTVLDPAAIPDTASGSVTYQITGSTDGVVIDTLTLTGSQYTASESVLSTPDSAAKLKISITDISTDPQ